MNDFTLTAKYAEALQFAFDLHQKQTRKVVNIPYYSHLMSVSALVFENGGDEEQAIGALLHDSIEDQADNFGGAEKLRNEIENRFGLRVLEIVNGCTDVETIPKPPWQERKEKYIAHLPTTESHIRLVVMADKFHNVRSVLSDYKKVGESVWDRFAGGKEGTIWYFRSIADIFLKTDPDVSLTLEFNTLVTELENLGSSST